MDGGREGERERRIGAVRVTDEEEGELRRLGKDKRRLT